MGNAGLDDGGQSGGENLCLVMVMVAMIGHSKDLLEGRFWIAFQCERAFS